MDGVAGERTAGEQIEDWWTNGCLTNGLARELRLSYRASIPSFLEIEWYREGDRIARRERGRVVWRE